MDLFPPSYLSIPAAGCTAFGASLDHRKVLRTALTAFGIVMRGLCVIFKAPYKTEDVLRLMYVLSSHSPPQSPPEPPPLKFLCNLQKVISRLGGPFAVKKTFFAILGTTMAHSFGLCSAFRASCTALGPPPQFQAPMQLFQWSSVPPRAFW